MLLYIIIFAYFFFNDTATTEIYTLSLHDALPISAEPARQCGQVHRSRRSRAARELRRHEPGSCVPALRGGRQDRKSTRLNSSHGYISYAVFCLKKKKEHNENHYMI